MHWSQPIRVLARPWLRMTADFACALVGAKITSPQCREVESTVSEQPDKPSGNIPEVIPTEHIAPEMPPAPPDAISVPAEVEPAADTAYVTPVPLTTDDVAPSFVEAPVAPKKSTRAATSQRAQQPQR